MTYLYDDENRLSGAVDYGTGFGASFVYDGLGRLREQLQWEQGQDTGSATRPGFGLDSGIPIGPSPPESPFDGDGWGLVGGILYVYDGNRVIQERAYFGGDPTVSYTRGSDLSGTLEGAGGIGGLLARSSGYDSGNWTTHCCYHADGNGNITYLETSAQGIGAIYRYDAFGNVLNRLDLSGDYAYVNTYRFSSKEWVPLANAYYYLYRFYDPGVQRWLNRDPLGERAGLNSYSFVLNNPLNAVDGNGDIPIKLAPIFFSIIPILYSFFGPQEPIELPENFEFPAEMPDPTKVTLLGPIMSRGPLLPLVPPPPPTLITRPSLPAGPLPPRLKIITPAIADEALGIEGRAGLDDCPIDLLFP